LVGLGILAWSHIIQRVVADGRSYGPLPNVVEGSLDCFNDTAFKKDHNSISRRPIDPGIVAPVNRFAGVIVGLITRQGSTSGA
jgi:hypothetical protein